MVFDIVQLPIIIGIVAVGIALADRAWKTFLEAKKQDPKLKFDTVYLTNALIASGTIITVITGVIPVVVAEVVPFPNGIVTIALVIANFTVGYLGTYRILDGLNKSSSQKIQIAELKDEAA